LRLPPPQGEWAVDPALEPVHQTRTEEDEQKKNARGGVECVRPC
jgi:hypothetical protein